jgi:hypothetical protein
MDPLRQYVDGQKALAHTKIHTDGLAHTPPSPTHPLPSPSTNGHTNVNSAIYAPTHTRARALDNQSTLISHRVMGGAKKKSTQPSRCDVHMLPVLFPPIVIQ